MMATRVVGISFREELLERLDKVRGLIPRSTWVNDALKKALDAAKKE